MTARPRWDSIEHVRHTLDATKQHYPGMIAALRTVDYIYGYSKPHFPMPALMNEPCSLIAWLWVFYPIDRATDRKLRAWFLALCFDKQGNYIG